MDLDFGGTTAPMTTPVADKRAYGFVSVGGRDALVNPFVSTVDSRGERVCWKFEFAENEATRVEVTDAYFTRFSDIRLPDSAPGCTFEAYTSTRIRPVVCLGEETTDVPLLRKLVVSEYVPISRKRRRRVLKRVSITGFLGQAQLRASSVEHLRRCCEEVRRLGHNPERASWSRAICAAAKVGYVTVRVEGHLIGATRVPFKFVGMVEMPPSQAFLPEFYPPIFTQALSAVRLRHSSEWSIESRFTAVPLAEISGLISAGGVVARIGTEILQSAILCFVQAWTEEPVVLVAGALKDVLRIRCEPVQGANAFAIIKLVVSLPLLFRTERGIVIGMERHSHAVVSPGGIYSVHRNSREMYNFPRVGIRPPDTMPIRRWTTQWWVSRSLAVRLSNISVCLCKRSAAWTM